MKMLLLLICYLLVLLLSLSSQSSSATAAEDDRVACVTGGSGYLALELTAQLLQLGWSVRATVRDLTRESSVAPLRELPFASGRLTLFEADLIAGSSNFVGCVAGASVVFHTASPFFTQDVTDPERELLEPALKGTEHVVGAALVADSVKKIILTSSIAATMSGSDDKGGACFNESDWNTKSTLQGRHTHGAGLDSYRYSKTAAERRFWEMISDPDLNPGLVQGAAILPSFIVGPPRSARTSGESATFMKMAMEGAVPYRGDSPMCDVRDVALAHIRAATVLSATSDGQHPARYIISSKRKVQRAQVLTWLNEKYPTFDVAKDLKSPIFAATSLPIMFCPTNLHKIGMAQLEQQQRSDDNLNREKDAIAAVSYLPAAEELPIMNLRDVKTSLLDMADAMVNLVKSVSPRMRAKHQVEEENEL